jgi:hypothetical protein
MPFHDDGQHCANNTGLHELVMSDPRDTFVNTIWSKAPVCVGEVGQMVLMGYGEELALSVKPHSWLQEDRVGVEDQDTLGYGASHKRQLEDLLLDPALPIFGHKFLHGAEGPRQVLVLVGQ